MHQVYGETPPRPSPAIAVACPELSLPNSKSLAAARNRTSVANCSSVIFNNPGNSSGYSTTSDFIYFSKTFTSRAAQALLYQGTSHGEPLWRAWPSQDKVASVI